MIPFASFAVLQVTLSLYLGGPGTVFMCCEYKHGRVHTARIASDSGSNSALFI